MPVRPYSAVIFDLYDTLVPGGARALRDGVSAAMAADLGVDPHAFAERVRASFDERARGRLGDLPSTIAVLAEHLGGQPSRPAIRAAERRRLELHRGLLQPAAETVSVLARLRDDGYKLGILSDTSAETPMLWPETALAGLVDAAVFSCVEGVRKPHPALYRRVAEALDVDPGACAYVGDGASDELNGAVAAGMTAIQLRVVRPDPVDAADHAAVYGARPWQGAAIDDLAALPNLLAAARGGR
jgi:putative hydrolase of the HAD superfamily